MNEHIDIYCERTDASFWSEPLNAVSNASFILAAIAIILMARQRGQSSLGLNLLIALALCIGTGSFLFHTFATRWAVIADVLPIVLFQIAFIAIYSRDVARASRLTVAIILLAFFATGYGFSQLPDEWLNGSLQYAPALLFLGGLALYHRLNHLAGPNLLIIGVCTFVISLTFRSIDMAVCETFPVGTHVFWHLLNGLVLYFPMRTILLNLPPKREA